MNELALFAGGCGGLLAGKLLGWTTRCAVEIDPYCIKILLARQRDGMLDRFPIWDDIKTFDGRPWRDRIDVVSGGFPCQDISCAGKGAGLTGERSELWFEMLRVIDEVRPRFVFAENSPNLRTRGLGTVLEGLAGLGYDARWCVLGAWHVGAPHRRNRMWIVAYSSREQVGRSGQSWPDVNVDVADASSIVRYTRREAEQEKPTFWWYAEPDVERVVYGMAHRVDRIRALGNGQVPLVAATAWRILTSDLNTEGDDE